MQHVGSDHVQPLFVGLDYRFVSSHRSYQQTLWQAIRSAQRHGMRRVLYGMSADLQKARFGATRERRWVYLQSTEGFQLDVLTQIGEQLTSPLDIEHRGWERLGADGPDWRERNTAGWRGLLPHFVAAATAR